MAANSPMFYIHDTQRPETSSSFDLETSLHKRKVPRLTLSTDVKIFSNCHNYTTLSIPPLTQIPHSPHGALSQMEADEVILYQNNFSKLHKLRTKRSSEKMNSCYGDERRSLNSAYPALLPTSFNADIPSSVKQCHVSTLYPQQSCDIRLDKPHHLQPSSCYPSPPHSTAASPLEMSNPLPPPIHPSPSLPLHQPRPSRRIPIVSLSRLASAAEKMDNGLAKRPNMHRQRLDSASRNVYSSGLRQSPYTRVERDRQTMGASREESATGRFLQCSCGCMESYAVG
ncbi:hypothetical protein D9756_005819 [Leucocoprinus leucothites]|uniref:Uncharacterized protein n=1 Tax=Leucocoprinus leucothites TaxID=201217 RepID=A0A8H5D4N9_9AGAR|nr:hypothetical protein D9756_005819 [Leucoagaricus leucothites]